MTIENDEQNEDKRQVGLDMQRTKPHKMRSYALLQTATAWTEEQYNAVYNRALLDKGSQRLFMVNDVSRRAGCEIMKEEKLTIRSFGNFETKRMINLVDECFKRVHMQMGT